MNVLIIIFLRQKYNKKWKGNYYNKVHIVAEIEKMKAAVITVAGISSRFNEGIEESGKCLKAIYTEGDASDTLLAHLVKKCGYADRIIIVGGYKYEELEQYIARQFSRAEKEKATLIYNEHYADLASGYSLYLGLEEAFRLSGLEEVLFVEGDLDIDDKSFKAAVKAEGDILTYHCSPIRASRDVLFYQGGNGAYKYLFNSAHGLLRIEEPFSCIYNSGQLWKFRNMEKLKEANGAFYEKGKSGTNLLIIQEYINRILQENIRTVCLDRWTNCNTREDYKNIKGRWEAEG